MNGELFHARKQRGAMEAEARGGTVRASDASFGFAQDVEDPLALFLEVFGGGRCRECDVMQLANGFAHDADNLFASGRTRDEREEESAAARSSSAKGNVQGFAARQDHGALDEIFEFANVAGPVRRR